jgi:hypothetical protein
MATFLSIFALFEQLFQSSHQVSSHILESGLGYTLLCVIVYFKYPLLAYAPPKFVIAGALLQGDCRALFIARSYCGTLLRDVIAGHYSRAERFCWALRYIRALYCGMLLRDVIAGHL